jgi:hypothetical protein
VAGRGFAYISYQGVEAHKMQSLLYLFVVYGPKKWFRGKRSIVLHPPPYAKEVINDETMTVVSLVVLDFPEQREPKRSVGQVVIILLI